MKIGKLTGMVALVGVSLIAAFIAGHEVGRWRATRGLQAESQSVATADLSDVEPSEYPESVSLPDGGDEIVDGVQHEILERVMGVAYKTLDEAWAAYEKDPTDSNALLSFALSEERGERLETILRKVVVDDPSNTEMVEILAYEFFQAQERYQDAVDFFAPLHRRSESKYPVIASVLAVMHDALGHSAEAIEFAKEAAANTDEPLYEVDLAEILAAAGKDGEALAAFMQARKELDAAEADGVDTSGMEIFDPQADRSDLMIELRLELGLARLDVTRKAYGEADARLAALSARLTQQRDRELAEAVDAEERVTIESFFDRQASRLQSVKARMPAH